MYLYKIYVNVYPLGNEKIYKETCYIINSKRYSISDDVNSNLVNVQVQATHYGTQSGFTFSFFDTM
jgi:hypothetical protein